MIDICFVEDIETAAWNECLTVSVITEVIFIGFNLL